MSTSSTTPEAGQHPEPTPSPLTPERLTEIAALVQAATEGPWRREDDAPSLTRLVVSDDSTLVVSLGYVGNRTQDDAAFIAAARTAVPELLDEVVRLDAELREFASRVNELESAICDCEPVREHRDLWRPAVYQHAATCAVRAGGAR